MDRSVLYDIAPIFVGRVNTLRSNEPEHPESLVELPNSPQNRQRGVFVPQLEIKWNSTQEEANALQVCEKNFVCQWDLYITGNVSLAVDTLKTQSAFTEAVKILSKSNLTL